MTDSLKPWYELDIDIKNAIRPDFDFKKMYEESEFSTSPIGIWFMHHEELGDIFTPEWLAYMDSLGLAPGTCMMFYRKPHYLYPAVHVDIHKATSQPAAFALNWVLDPDDDSEMIWYDWPEEETEYDITPAGTPYLSWPNEKFEGKPYVSRTIGNKMTLVKTGQPHNVIVRDKERWVISIRFPINKDNNAISDWKSAVEYFKPFIKE